MLSSLIASQILRFYVISLRIFPLFQLSALNDVISLLFFLLFIVYLQETLNLSKLRQQNFFSAFFFLLAIE